MAFSFETSFDCLHPFDKRLVNFKSLKILAFIGDYIRLSSPGRSGVSSQLQYFSTRGQRSELTVAGGLKIGRGAVLTPSLL